MAFNRQDGLAISWYVEPTDADKRHLDISGVTRVQIGYQMAVTKPAVVDYLASKGKRVILRLDVDTRSLGAVDTLILNLRALQLRARIEALILGVEPEGQFTNMAFGSPTWGNDDHMWDHRLHMQRLILQLHDAGFGAPGQLRLISPGFTHRMPRPSVKPFPGTMRWYIACQDVYALCNGSAMHLYTDNYRSPVDLERLQAGFALWASMWEWPFFIDEIGINNGSQMERTNGVLAFAEWLLQPAQQQVGGAGYLTECICQFTGNGSPPPDGSWGPGFLLTEDGPYYAMANWRAGTWHG